MTFKIGKKTIGQGHPCYIIAEVGSNHDGKLDQAKELIRSSADIGADAVKFQSFSAEGLINNLKLDKNKRWIPHPAFDIIKKLEIPDRWHEELFDYANSLGIEFLSAPFDLKKAEMLNNIGVRAFKIASGDITYRQILERVASYKKPIILSTGASYLKEIVEAVKTIKTAGCSKYAVLHCVSNYPPRFEDANIKAIVTLKKTFKCPVGYSDHSPGITVPLGAVALGANIIEKHITISRQLKGPDHPYALEVNEFAQMIKEIRNLEKALGNGVKKPVKDEIGERIGARRSLYATTDINKGEIITKDMIKIVRHGYGLPPSQYENIIGKRSKLDIKKDELIR